MVAPPFDPSVTSESHVLGQVGLPVSFKPKQSLLIASYSTFTCPPQQTRPHCHQSMDWDLNQMKPEAIVKHRSQLATTNNPLRKQPQTDEHLSILSSILQVKESQKQLYRLCTSDICSGFSYC